ncbi:hypothetical protein [uncultured Secundilactobacillus sp.]|uniref:hypothetical protein n=1 Tax=uncultured Secundilactobacillus sp. TaxID=2813935 RepID=UPI0025901A7D|nr:hypothetical protein [uncultured Secundilactobacillus sp.]
MKFLNSIAYLTLFFQIIVISAFIVNYLQLDSPISFLVLGSLQIANTIFGLTVSAVQRCRGKVGDPFSLAATMLSFCVTVCLLIASKFVF